MDCKQAIKTNSQSLLDHVWMDGKWMDRILLGGSAADNIRINGNSASETWVILESDRLYNKNFLFQSFVSPTTVSRIWPHQSKTILVQGLGCSHNNICADTEDSAVHQDYCASGNSKWKIHTWKNCAWICSNANGHHAKFFYLIWKTWKIHTQFAILEL